MSGGLAPPEPPLPHQGAAARPDPPTNWHFRRAPEAPVRGVQGGGSPPKEQRGGGPGGDSPW
eukprot:6778869-Alexandrium_andersonii.AAC.1